MHNILLRTTYWLFMAVIILVSCEKLEIPKTDKDDAEQPEHPTNDENSGNNEEIITDDYNEDDPYQGWGSLENMINNGGTIARPYRAKDLAKGELGEWVVSHDVASMPNCWVEGYIVGYVKGTSMSSAILFKNGSKETNILIASDTTNIDANDCVPIGLSKGSSYIKTREALNLKDNPEIMRRKVKVLGSISKYMGTAGLKNARDYRFTDGK